LGRGQYGQHILLFLPFQLLDVLAKWAFVGFGNQFIILVLDTIQRFFPAGTTGLTILSS